MREESILVGPHNIGVKHQSVNHTLCDREIRYGDGNHQKEPSSCKENEKCQIVVIGAMNAVRGANSQAVPFLAPTTQHSCMVVGTLSIRIFLKINVLFVHLTVVYGATGNHDISFALVAYPEESVPSQVTTISIGEALNIIGSQYGTTLTAWWFLL